MKTQQAWTMAGCLAVILLGCGGSKPTTEMADSKSCASCAHGEHGGKHGCDHDSCPMMVEGVTVAYEEMPDGAAIVFTTTSGDVTDLQRRIAEKAERHNQPDHPMKGGEVAHTARADNVVGGARLVMVPSDAKDLEALRAHVKKHVDSMQKGGCPMDCCGNHGEAHGEHGEHHGEHHEHGEQHGEHHEHEEQHGEHHDQR